MEANPSITFFFFYLFCFFSDLSPQSFGRRRGDKNRGEKENREESRWFVREKRRRPIEVKRRQKEDVTVTIFFFVFCSLLSFVPSPVKLLAASTTGTFFFFVPEVDTCSIQKGQNPPGGRSSPFPSSFFSLLPMVHRRLRLGSCPPQKSQNSDKAKREKGTLVEIISGQPQHAAAAKQQLLSRRVGPSFHPGSAPVQQPIIAANQRGY